MFVESTGRPPAIRRLLRTTLADPDARHVVILMFLAAVILCGQIQNEVLYSVDGIVYALIGKELTLRPISQWAILTWNGAAFYEHPHLTPWMLGASMKVFGVSTLTAILPILLIALATVLLAYLLGRVLLDHRLGLLAGTVLTLTPEFVRGGRNPMLEPALMFFIMLAVYFHVAATRPGGFLRNTILSGLSVGLALLAKGPPAILALAVIIAFQCAARAFPGAFKRLMLPGSRLSIHVSALLLISLAVVMLVDLWHRAVAGTSFFAHYISHQLNFTIVEGRGVAGNDWTFYLNTFLRDWPWWPLVLVSILLVAWKRDRVAVPALVLGALVTAGTYFGFTLMTHKAEWYTAIHYVGSSLLAALTLRYLVSERALERYYATVTLALIVPTLFLSASVPSLFLQYGRPFERFMDRAHAELGGTLEGEPLADCVSVEPWKGPFFLSFYLGVHKVDCEDIGARFKLIDNRKYVTKDGYRIVFSEQPFSIVERVSK
jgi:4-amino-4-deoxy-L-arabinose transferase-like glycosyltransferase